MHMIFIDSGQSGFFEDINLKEDVIAPLELELTNYYTAVSVRESSLSLLLSLSITVEFLKMYAQKTCRQQYYLSTLLRFFNPFTEER